jgi:hypothetical protein
VHFEFETPTLDAVRNFVYEKGQSPILPVVCWPISLYEAKRPFFYLLSTRLISSLEVRELVSQVDHSHTLVGEQLQYFFSF